MDVTEADDIYWVAPKENDLVRRRSERESVYSSVFSSGYKTVNDRMILSTLN